MIMHFQVEETVYRIKEILAKFNKFFYNIIVRTINFVVNYKRSVAHED